MLVFELVILAVVLLAAGFAGYQYMENTMAVNRATVPKPRIVAKASPSPSQSPAKPANEFDIPELGIKMTLPPGLTGLTYSAQTDQPGSADNQNYEVSVVRFSTAQLTQLGGSQYCGASSGPIGGFALYLNSYDPVGHVVLSGPTNVKLVGANYIGFYGPQATCSANDSVDNLETADLKLLLQAYSTVSPL